MTHCPPQLGLSTEGCTLALEKAAYRTEVLKVRPEVSFQGIQMEEGGTLAMLLGAITSFNKNVWSKTCLIGQRGIKWLLKTADYHCSTAELY